MRSCIHCQTLRDYSIDSCPVCRQEPVSIGGFPAYAPELAYGGGGFHADYFQNLARLEAGNFWFQARNALVIWAIRKYAPSFRTMLEIGCGTGFVLSGIAASFPGTRLTGSELFIDGLGFAASRLPNAELLQMDARHVPFCDEFDVVGAFDVLEHIKEDEAALAQVRQCLRPGGVAVLAVPQHRWLWSASDEYAYHERRYAVGELERKVRHAGLEVLRSTSFVTSLLPLMLLSRSLQRKRENFDPIAEFRISRFTNTTLRKMLELELAGIKLGMNYPVGGSRLVVARRPLN